MRLFLLITLCIGASAWTPYIIKETGAPRTLPAVAERVIEKLRESNPNKLLAGLDLQADNTTCEACKIALNTIETLLKQNHSVNEIENLAVTVCVLALPVDICRGAVVIFGESIMEIIKLGYAGHAGDMCYPLNMCPRGRTRRDFGSEFPHLPATASADDRELHAHKLLHAYSTPDRSLEELVMLPPAKPAPEIAPTKPQAVSTFLHVTDIHWDAWYVAGSNNKCGKPSCCRAIDGPGNAQGEAGMFGDYHCDDPQSAIDVMFATISQLNPKPDFVVFTGDSPADDVWSQSRGEVLHALDWLAQKLAVALPGVKVIPAVGNHDMYPIGMIGGPGKSDAWLFEHLASKESWGVWLQGDDRALADLRSKGYFSTLVKPGLRIISLNTQYGDGGNFWTLLNMTDIGGQLAWFNTQLAQARTSREKVYIIGHVPFADGILRQYSNALHALIDQYQDVVAALFFGHTHMDSVQMVRDVRTNTRPIAVSYVAPSVTPQTDINPSFRVYQYDTTTFEVLDYAQYMADLEAANKNKRLQYNLLYTAKQSYGLPSLKPADWQNLLTRMFNDTALAKLYLNHHVTMRPTSCDKDPHCIRGLICNSLSCTPDLFDGCMGKPGAAVIEQSPTVWQPKCGGLL